MIKNINEGLIRQGVLQVGAAKLSGNRPILWFCHDEAARDYIKKKFFEYQNGLQNINFFILP